MRTSTRSKVDPFIVMDVMEAARRAEEAGRHIIHMEVGATGHRCTEGCDGCFGTRHGAGAPWVYRGSWPSGITGADRTNVW